MTWCWHPSRRVDRQPMPSDYQCCCGRCTAKTGFTVLTVLSIVGFIFGRLGHESTDEGFMAYAGAILSGYIGIELLMLVFAVMALRTEKPVWMQIILTIQVILTACGLLILILWGFIMISIAESVRDQNKVVESFLTVGIIVGVVYGGYSAWYLSLIYSYYSYLRDQQLWLEQQGDPMSQLNAEPQPMYYTQ